MELDFSKLDKLPYRGFETAEARAEKDALIEQGFTILEGPTPFDTPEGAEAKSDTAPAGKPTMQRNATDAPTAPTAPPQTARAGRRETGNPSAGAAQTAPQSATRRERREFAAPTDPTRDYRAMYAALFRFHERHSSPRDCDPDKYWAAVCDDMSAVGDSFGNDPFLTGLLLVVFEELEREYKTLMHEGHDRGVST